MQLTRIINPFIVMCGKVQGFPNQSSGEERRINFSEYFKQETKMTLFHDRIPKWCLFKVVATSG